MRKLNLLIVLIILWVLIHNSEDPDPISRFEFPKEDIIKALITKRVEHYNLTSDKQETETAQLFDLVVATISEIKDLNLIINELEITQKHIILGGIIKQSNYEVYKLLESGDTKELNLGNFMLLLENPLTFNKVIVSRRNTQLSKFMIRSNERQAENTSITKTSYLVALSKDEKKIIVRLWANLGENYSYNTTESNPNKAQPLFYSPTKTMIIPQFIIESENIDSSLKSIGSEEIKIRNSIRNFLEGTIITEQTPKDFLSKKLLLLKRISKGYRKVISELRTKSSLIKTPSNLSELKKNILALIQIRLHIKIVSLLKEIDCFYEELSDHFMDQTLISIIKTKNIILGLENIFDLEDLTRRDLDRIYNNLTKYVFWGSRIEEALSTILMKERKVKSNGGILTQIPIKILDENFESKSTDALPIIIKRSGFAEDNFDDLKKFEKKFLAFKKNQEIIFEIKNKFEEKGSCVNYDLESKKVELISVLKFFENNTAQMFEKFFRSFLLRLRILVKENAKITKTIKEILDLRINLEQIYIFNS